MEISIIFVAELKYYYETTVYCNITFRSPGPERYDLDCLFIKPL